MKTISLCASFLLFVSLCLPGCMKDDLDAIDIKIDGSSKTSFRTGSSGFGAANRTRTGISF